MTSAMLGGFVLHYLIRAFVIIVCRSARCGMWLIELGCGWYCRVVSLRIRAAAVVGTGAQPCGCEEESVGRDESRVEHRRPATRRICRKVCMAATWEQGNKVWWYKRPTRAMRPGRVRWVVVGDKEWTELGSEAKDSRKE